MLLNYYFFFLSDRVFLIYFQLCISFAFILWSMLIHHGTIEIPGRLLLERNEDCEFEQLIFSILPGLTAAFFLTEATLP